MNILIAPLIRNPKIDASYFLTKNLANLFVNNNHNVAVSSFGDNGFHNVSLYGCPKLRKPIINSHNKMTSYEEWLYYYGALSEAYLQEDIDYILEAILLFKPDLIITIDRIAPIIAARLTNVRCWSVVTSSMYKNKTFDPNTIKGLNTFLTNNRQRQVLHIYELFRLCERKFVFGPFETEPFDEEDDVTRIEMPFITPYPQSKEKHICVYLADVKKPVRTVYKTIEEAFKGAPYDVYASSPDTRVGNVDNMHFLKNPKEDLIPSCSCLIHDGNDYFFNMALTNGIPQVIIGASEYLRFANARSAQRCSVGVYIFDEEFDMGTLYESYRRVITDEAMIKDCERTQSHILSASDLTKILAYL